jgi:hypothetical protein
METGKEVTAEVKEPAADAAAGLHPKVQLSTLREVVDSEGFHDKRGWRRILAMWGATNAPFSR